MAEKHQLQQEGDLGSEYHYESQKTEEFEIHSTPSYTSNTKNLNDDVESLQHGTKRGLHARHIQMISLGGAIGYIDL
jgi:amino acid permease